MAHPAFLSSDELATTEAPTPEPADEPRSTKPLAINPDDADHLRALVDAALVPVFGGLPEHDSDNDVPVVNGSGLVWVRVLERRPVVQLFSALVLRRRRPRAAAFEVGVLNRDVQFLKFILLEDTVMAYLYIPALPFAPLHLRAMLDLMCTDGEPDRQGPRHPRRTGRRGVRERGPEGGREAGPRRRRRTRPCRR